MHHSIYNEIKKEQKKNHTEDQNDSLENEKSNTPTTDLPLSGVNKAKIIGFFLILILPLFLFFNGEGNPFYLDIPIMIIAFFALYYAKKYFSFLPINRAKIYMKNYLIRCWSIFYSIFCLCILYG